MNNNNEDIFYFTALGKEYKARYNKYYDKYWVESLDTGYMFYVDKGVFDEYYNPKPTGDTDK